MKGKKKADIQPIRTGSQAYPRQIFKAILSVLRRTDPEFPIQYALCLCEIADAEGLSVTELADRTDLALSTVSRIVGALSDYRSNGQPFELISLKIAPEERRRKALYLTPKGRKLLQDIESILS